MLLAYDKAGAVIFQVGANSLHPDGPPEEALPEQFASVGVDPVGWVRINDDEDADLVAAVLVRGATVKDGEVILGPEPEPAVLPAAGEDPLRIADLEAKLEAQGKQLAAFVELVANHSAASVQAALDIGAITAEQAELLAPPAARASST